MPFYDLVSITGNLSVEDGTMYETHSPMCAICCCISKAQQHIDDSDNINTRIGTYQGSLQKTLEQRLEDVKRCAEVGLWYTRENIIF